MQKVNKQILLLLGNIFLYCRLCTVYTVGSSDIASPLLSLAVSSFNNRSLAHLKLNMFREAIDDASFVVDHYLDGEGPLLSAPSPPATVVSKEMFLKAIFRRAQARLVRILTYYIVVNIWESND